MRAPRLVATDVDGTLLGDAPVPSPRVSGVLARMAAAGVPLVLATGRPPRWVPPVTHALGVQGLVVAANGAVLYDADADLLLHTATLDPPEVGVVLELLREAVPGCGLAVERVGAAADGRPTEEFVSETGDEHGWFSPDHLKVAASEMASQPVIKILARNPEWTSEEMAATAAPLVDDLVDITFSFSRGLIECSARGVTKAAGLALAADRLGVAAADVVAFGDMPNDVAMLRWAGHGVAMANAHPEVLEAADEITASNVDDGVASVLERWF